MAKHRNNGKMLTQSAIISRYGVTKKIIDRYFPKPVVHYDPKRSWAYTRLWNETDIQFALQKPEVQEALLALNQQRQEDKDRIAAREFLIHYDPASMIEKGRLLNRRFVLHVGPTNSGKTHDAVEALCASGNGTYLGPLRLLALEMFERINQEGIPCSLKTGEEAILVENEQVVSSTIELCDYQHHFKTAVIDEAQLVADENRGAAWFRAICEVDAEEVQICLAPEALGFIESMVRQFGSPYTVVTHERLVPLVYSGRCHGFHDIQPGDAVICFSRKNVLSTAALLERSGFKTSVIYGTLPPVARRNEVEKYTSGNSNVIVATDAIGMGISLPIRRVIFAESQKFDGKVQRPLNSAEIRQIAGRAGRFGMFDRGEVLTMDRTDTIENGLNRAVPPVRKPCIAFPREALSTDLPLMILLKTWQDLPKNPEFRREDVSDAITLLSLLRRYAKGHDRSLIYDLITCPTDTNLQDLKYYWLSCARAILDGRHIPRPHFDTDTLEGCELQYKGYDVHHQLLQRMNLEDNCTDEQAQICQRIKELMAEDKSGYIRRCRVCGRELPLGYSFNVCEKCFRAEQ